jgi:uncharacterized protein (TIGR03000 family)
MYTMVVMMALGTSADLPDFGRRGGGCCGCYGGGWGGCYGGWGGCYGGWGGCYGGCWGGGWGGCYGGGWGGCYGGYAGWGGGYGGGWGGGYGGTGWGGWGYAALPATTYAAPALASAAPVMSGSPTQSFYYNPGTQAAPNNTATMIVHLPADANLIIDGQRTNSTSDRRVFHSPPLEPGKTYHYTLKATMNRNGEKEETTRNVQVRAGKTAEVYLDFPTRSAGNGTSPRP